MRLACSSVQCQFVSWNNPIPVVAGLVRNEASTSGENATWPEGMFSMITGFLEQGESPESAILRETEEELGLKGSACKFIGHYPHPRFNQLIIAYAVEAHGQVKLNDEIAEVRRVSPEQLATYDFGRLGLIRTIVSHWLESA
ncbi:MAG: NUDIX domain-containing protein [Propionivibrio sp.]|nr:NUDIX domain-containing protein [Propionivibrio sp.]